MSKQISKRRKCFLWFPIRMATYTIQEGFDDIELVVETGLIFKKIEKTKLFKVSDISYERSVGNFFFGVACVKIHSSDASCRVIYMHKIRKARVFMEEIEKIVADERKRVNIGYREGVML